MIACLGYTFYSNYRYRNEPPKMTQFVPVPIQIGDKSMLLGVAIEAWQVPEELNAAFVEAEKQKLLATEKAAGSPSNDINKPAATVTNAATKSK